MPDDAQGFRPIDPGRVNAVDPLELAWWSQEFGCTLELLEAAIGTVGEHVAEIRGELARRIAAQR